MPGRAGGGGVCAMASGIPANSIKAIADANSSIDLVLMSFGFLRVIATTLFYNHLTSSVNFKQVTNKQLLSRIHNISSQRSNVTYKILKRYLTQLTEHRTEAFMTTANESAYIETLNIYIFPLICKWLWKRFHRFYKY
jgi:hypothetical protein